MMRPCVHMWTNAARGNDPPLIVCLWCGELKEKPE
jgi:hypothetical protein